MPRKREPGALIKLVVDKLNLRKALADEKTEDELVQAGFRGQSPLFIFLGLRFGLPFVFGGAAALYLYFIKTRVPGDENNDFAVLPRGSICRVLLAIVDLASDCEETAVEHHSGVAGCAGPQSDLC